MVEAPCSISELRDGVLQALMLPPNLASLLTSSSPYCRNHVGVFLVAALCSDTSTANGMSRQFIEFRRAVTTLGVSTRTVETQKYWAPDALGLRTTADLIRYAREHGLITPPRHG
jgi:hypothetical protein